VSYIEEVIRRNIMKLVTEGRYNDADKITREYIRRIHENKVRRLKGHEFLRLLRRVSYVFKYIYDESGLNIDKVHLIGPIIAWIEVVENGHKILELGTDLGITCSIIMKSFSVEEYITVDDSSLMLAIALFNNPIDECRRALWNCKVKVLLGNPRQVVVSMRREIFDHVICKVPIYMLRKHYTTRLFKRLVTLLKGGGTMSIFIEKDFRLINKIRYSLSLMGMQVHVMEVPCISAITLHAMKRFL